MCSKGLLTLGYEGAIICLGGEIVTEGFFIKKIKVLLFLNFFADRTQRCHSGLSSL